MDGRRVLPRAAVVVSLDGRPPASMQRRGGIQGQAPPLLPPPANIRSAAGVLSAATQQNQPSQRSKAIAALLGTWASRLLAVAPTRQDPSAGGGGEEGGVNMGGWALLAKSRISTVTLTKHRWKAPSIAAATQLQYAVSMVIVPFFAVG